MDNPPLCFWFTSSEIYSALSCIGCISLRCWRAAWCIICIGNLTAMNWSTSLPKKGVTLGSPLPSLRNCMQHMYVYDCICNYIYVYYICYLYISYIYIYVIIDVYIILYYDLIFVGKTLPFLLIDSPQILFGQYLHDISMLFSHNVKLSTKKQVAEKNNSE